jgi:hypothetical protein
LEYLGLHNKPKAAVHPGHKRADPKEDEDEDGSQRARFEAWVHRDRKGSNPTAIQSINQSIKPL